MEVTRKYPQFCFHLFRLCLQRETIFLKCVYSPNTCNVYGLRTKRSKIAACKAVLTIETKFFAFSHSTIKVHRYVTYFMAYFIPVIKCYYIILHLVKKQTVLKI